MSVHLAMWPFPIFLLRRAFFPEKISTSSTPFFQVDFRKNMIFSFFLFSLFTRSSVGKVTVMGSAQIWCFY